MKTIDELIAEMEALQAEISKIEERIDSADSDAKRELLTEELESKVADFDAKEAEVKRLESAAKRADRLKQLKPTAPQKPDAEPENKSLDEPDVELPDSEHNLRQVQAKKDRASWLYLSHPKSGSDAIQEIARKDGDQLVEAIRLNRLEAKEDAGAIQPPSWMKNFILPQPTALDVMGKASSNDVLVGDASGTNSGGGSLVDTDFVPQLYRRDLNVVHDLASKCYVKRAVGKTAVFPKLTQAAATPFGIAITRGDGSGSSGEGQGITESNPQFSQVEISTGRVAALSQASLKEVRNSDVGFEAELAWMFRNAVRFAYSQDVIEGSYANHNGAGLPLGINTNTSIGTHGVATRAREVASQVSYADLAKMQFDVDEGITDEGTYIISGGASGAMQFMVSLDDNDGRPVFFSVPGGYINWALGQAASPKVVAGRPFVRTKANSANVGSRGDIIYGNLRHYGFVVDTDEMGVERSDHYAFNTGLVTFRLITYVGGRVLAGQAFCVLADVSTASSSSSSSS